MTLNRTIAGRFLHECKFEDLFIEELGWDEATTPPLDISVSESSYLLRPIAQKRGLMALELRSSEIPPYAVRRKIETQVAKRYREHVIVFVDDSDKQIWQWVRRTLGQPLRCHEHMLQTGQSGEALMQKLDKIQVSLDQEEDLTLVDVVGQVSAAFNVERATKSFFREFNKQREAFQKFLDGIPDADLESWYVSVMLNRLMFIYFIQKKGFLHGDIDYLRHRLDASEQVGQDLYYQGFLCPLFFEGFAKPAELRDPDLSQRLGRIPYLNGGIFQRHQVEQLHGKTIQVPDKAFRQLFDFFDRYQWHLDDRPLRDDNEINPDVLGYIFEQYVNNKQMGAYYTKEDITEYISKNTIIPFLFDRAQKLCPEAFEGEDAPWVLLQVDPDRYIYPAVRKGVELPLPDEIEAGIEDVSLRGQWNTPTPEAYAQPTEIWRETVARRQRYEENWLKLVDGDVRNINDLITLNLDIRQFAQDTVEQAVDPELVRTFWKVATEITILDPTCGSGAFLFAALNILKPIYEGCLDRMQQLIDESEGEAYPDFQVILDDIAPHPNQEYFILKRIMVNNLYGVDIMEEATEIAKLRLFLRLVALVEDVKQIEPLPDIDFNIRAGNTLVGFTSLDQVEEVVRGDRLILLPEDEALLAEIATESKHVDQLYDRYHQLQTDMGKQDSNVDLAGTKTELRRRLASLEDRLNRLLALQYGIEPNTLAFDPWVKSHQPFHWSVEFYGIISQGGFNVAIGNPPYVEMKNVSSYDVRGYVTEQCSDLFAYVMERSANLTKSSGYNGFIVPLSCFTLGKFHSLQELYQTTMDFLAVSHWSGDAHPSKLFEGVNKRLEITLGRRSTATDFEIYSSKYLKWYADERRYLFDGILAYRAVSHLPKDTFFDASLPKIESWLAESALMKLLEKPRVVGTLTRRNCKHSIYYTRKVSFFLQFLDFVPEVRDRNGNLREPSELKILSFDKAEDRDLCLACLSSSLFYWYYIANSDCRNLNKREVDSFPVPDPKDELPCRQFSGLLSRLMNSYKEHSELRTVNYRNVGDVTVQYFNFRGSKPIIDEIDHELARAYNLTDEELDYIINYDIKYRMGSELFSDDEGDE